MGLFGVRDCQAFFRGEGMKLGLQCLDNHFSYSCHFFCFLVDIGGDVGHARPGPPDAIEKYIYKLYAHGGIFEKNTPHAHARTAARTHSCREQRTERERKCCSIRHALAGMGSLGSFGPFPALCESHEFSTCRRFNASTLQRFSLAPIYFGGKTKAV